MHLTTVPRLNSSPNQTYPISMLYRYRSTIQEDAAKLRTKEAVKGRRYYGVPRLISHLHF